TTGHEPHTPRVTLLPDVDVVAVQLADPGVFADAADSSFHAGDGRSPRSRPVRSVAARPDELDTCRPSRRRRPRSPCGGSPVAAGGGTSFLDLAPWSATSGPGFSHPPSSPSTRDPGSIDATVAVAGSAPAELAVLVAL